MNPDFSGQAMIVTGAAGGIGAATARALAAAGAALVLVDRDAARLDALAAEIAAEIAAAPAPLALALRVDSETDMARMAEATLERHGRIDALVAAAGILRTSGQPRALADTGRDEWDAVIGVNLTGTFLSNRAVLPAMTARGAGDIVNLSSVSGRQGRAFDGPYAASKFGIRGLSQSLAEEVARLGIRVQTVLPDAVDTAIWDQSGTTALKPPAMLHPDRIAQTIKTLIALPRDTTIPETTVKPVKQRNRKKN